MNNETLQQENHAVFDPQQLKLTEDRVHWVLNYSMSECIGGRRRKKKRKKEREEEVSQNVTAMGIRPNFHKSINVPQTSNVLKSPQAQLLLDFSAVLHVYSLTP